MKTRFLLLLNNICKKKDANLQIGKEELLKETLAILRKALQDNGVEKKKNDCKIT